MPNEIVIDDLSLEDLRVHAKAQKETIETLTTQVNNSVAEIESKNETIAELTKEASAADEIIKDLKTSQIDLKATIKKLKKDPNADVPNDGSDAPLLKYPSFTLGDKQFKFRVAGKFMALDQWHTPTGIMELAPEKRDALLAELVGKHPTLFTETFSQ